MLGCLREVYDGSYTRRFGNGGGPLNSTGCAILFDARLMTSNASWRCEGSLGHGNPELGLFDYSAINVTVHHQFVQMATAGSSFRETLDWAERPNSSIVMM